MGQLEDMDTFIRIVEAGGISRAADQLGVAKSAVSRRLVELEKRLGVQLLTRTTRQSSLTESGRGYYQRALQIIADVGELNAVTSNTETVLEGRLRISAPLSFGLQHLAAAINEFAQINRGLTIHLDFSDRQIDLVEEGFDVAVRIAELHDSSLIARKLAPISNILCASPAYLDRVGHPQTPHDLKSHSILHYANDMSSSWKFVGPDGSEISVRLPATLSANNGDYLCEAAVAGLGLARLPTFLVWQKIQTGELVSVMTDYTAPSFSVYAVYPQTRHLSIRVRAFIDFLIDRFKGEPYWDRGV
ncbi:MAG: LysR family transcriptional regulator [bacterium]